MRNIFRDRDGYILILGLIVMPVFIGFGLLIVDVGRGNNAQSDLSAAADAAALAAARELDGGFDAIPRAKAAMALLTNSVSMLSQGSANPTIPLVYQDTSGNEFSIVFLEKIPASDDIPIDATWISNHTTTSGADAEYVYVKVQSVNLDSIFLNPVDLLRGSVPVAAHAVAKTQSAACDVTPIYICNPFEFDSTGAYVGDLLQQRFQNGELHGRIVKLHPKGNSTHAPGNFGFLQTNGSSSADAIRDIFAGNRNPSCYEDGTVTTKPGAATSIGQGMNVRFDVYDGPFNNFNPDGPNGFPISPALNVRKGYVPTVTGGNGNSTPNIDDCNASLSDDYFGNADGVLDGVWGLADNYVVQPPNVGVPGAYIGIGDWPIDQYLTEVYGGGVAPAIRNAIPSSFPSNLTGGVGAAMPSRYDVYRHEIDTGLYLTRTIGSGTAASPTGESGAALCGPSKSRPIAPTTDPDRRIIFAAIVDCGTAAPIVGGGTNDYPVNSYASVFLVRPMEGNETIDVEIVDISGWGGNGTLEKFIREEAILVR